MPDGYWDDVKGGWLDSKLIAQARKEEMAFVSKHCLYERVPREECYRETGKAPIKTGWADTNKGSEDQPNIRSRWVAKEYNTCARPDLFAATTPLEGVKLVVSDAASAESEDVVLAVIDVRRAYFYAKAKRKLYVELPPEDWQEGDEHMCGRLNYSLYGLSLIHI